MKQRITTLTLMACVAALLSAGPAAADASGPEDNGCSYLEVKLQDDQHKMDWVNCGEGEVVQRRGNKVKFIQGNGVRTRIECTIAFVHVSPSFPTPNVVRFTQNKCVWKAGNIHVRQVSGRPPIYRDREGSYGNSRPGKVVIKGFGENPEPPDWVPDLPK
jgi:hypothetical protein